ncbi:MoxR family ATPase [bacterium]|nr:MoxR family ATPase [bacterium]
MSQSGPATIADIGAAYARLRETLAAVLVGQEEAVRLAFITLLCSAHSLIEGVPGIGKTLLVRALAACLDVRFGRVQFTPDLLPGDVIGMPVLDPARGELRFRPGPLFTDLLLADEINRAPAKTQAALLEAMQERAATIDGQRHALGPHFAVFATQNPVEQEGTYPLPEAELDRFLFKIAMAYPDEEEERGILRLHQDDRRTPAALPRVLDAATLEQARDLVRAVIVQEEIIAYAAALVRATRADLSFALGASPRAGVLLLRAAKANATLEGRDFVIPEDVQEMLLPVLRHRVQLDPAAEVEGTAVDQALRQTLQSVTVPR